jgi:hypothetical protein
VACPGYIVTSCLKNKNQTKWKSIEDMVEFAFLEIPSWFLYGEYIEGI